LGPTFGCEARFVDLGCYNDTITESELRHRNNGNTLQDTTSRYNTSDLVRSTLTR
jgi:hypothetical protein